MKKNDRCPFLEEVVVRYCKALSIKKMIPANRLLRDDPCIGCPNKCLIYQEVSHSLNGSNQITKPVSINTDYGCDNLSLEQVRGFSFHPSVLYLDNHIWLSIENNKQVRIGFDGFASKLLSGISEIRTENNGELLNNITVKYNGQIVEIPVQIKGIIDRINEKVVFNPSLIKDNPYEHWLYIVKSESLGESVKNTRQGSEARKWLEREIDLLQEMLLQECGVTLADGGEIVADLQERIQPVILEKTIKRFLKKMKKQNLDSRWNLSRTAMRYGNDSQ